MINPNALDWLNKAYSSERLAQAYVIVGPPRQEGSDLVNQMLQLLFCEAEETRPCLTCDGCKRAVNHTHPDLQWIEPQKKSRIVSADQVRVLQQQIYKTAFIADWKACVIVGADRMQKSAGNILLKTLEEPPAGSIFFLLTDSPQFLLPTIKSRCQLVTASTKQQSIPQEWLLPLLEILTGRAGTGGVITAFARADKITTLLKEAKKDALSIEKDIAKKENREETKETLEARGSSRYRELRTGIMRAIMLWYRDILVLVCNGSESTLHYKDKKNILYERAKKISYTQAITNIATIENITRQFERNMPEGRVLGTGLCKIIG
jgi:DNA polymerase-3 subunit delta'